MLPIHTCHQAHTAQSTAHRTGHCGGRFTLGALVVGALVVGAAVAALFLLTGCVGLDGVTEAREHARAIAQHSDERVEALRAQLDHVTPESAHATALRTELSRAEAARDAVHDALAQADAIIAAASDPGSADPGRTNAAVGTLAALLPEPIRMPAALGTALVLALARARQLKLAAASIAKSVDLASRADPELKVRLIAQAPTLRSTQTPTAGRIVDETVGLKPMLKLPV